MTHETDFNAKNENKFCKPLRIEAHALEALCHEITLFLASP